MWLTSARGLNGWGMDEVTTDGYSDLSLTVA